MKKLIVDPLQFTKLLEQYKGCLIVKDDKPVFVSEDRQYELYAHITTTHLLVIDPGMTTEPINYVVQ